MLPHLTRQLVKFVRSEDGPTAVEYAVMLALIIVVCIAAITTLGSNANGTAFSSAPGMPEMTCGEWTKSGDGSAMTGHHDRTGLASDAWSVSWNSSHNSVGCSQQALTRTGGAGLFYCFAAD